ncbi:MAG TPA: thiamine phosphate synthase [Xanthobacteraceae bacterium]|nr:thiamine phosphate synthase [Xanthobacteraceae bacterium]
MTVRRSATDQGRSAPRLYLVTPPLGTPALGEKLAEALEAADVAAVLARVPVAGDSALIEQVRAIAPAIQDRGVALLIEGHPESVEPAGADGAHVIGMAALETALSALKPRYIVGCGGLGSRHDAMVAGERGADYVMFGEPDADGRRPAFAAVLDRVAWWAELFEIPCVGWAMNLDEVAALAGAGADFVAIADAVWTGPSGPGAAVTAAAARLKTSEPVP